MSKKLLSGSKECKIERASTNGYTVHTLGIHHCNHITPSQSADSTNVPIRYNRAVVWRTIRRVSKRRKRRWLERGGGHLVQVVPPGAPGWCLIEYVLLLPRLGKGNLEGNTSPFDLGCVKCDRNHD